MIVKFLSVRGAKIATQAQQQQQNCQEEEEEEEEREIVEVNSIYTR
jgi:hypothetical protein